MGEEKPMSIATNRYSEIWGKVNAKIKEKITDPVLYDSMFCELKLHSIEKDEVTLIANSEVSKIVLAGDYSNLLKESFFEVCETDYKIKICTEKELKARIDDSSIGDKKHDSKKFFAYSSLQPKYTFENFVRGTSNLQAYQASVHVANNMGSINPLFIYSKSGLGKTHLLNAIGNSVKDKYPRKNILFITADDFVAEYVNYVKGDQDGENLKDFFRTVDYLLIDDIQFMANKPQTCTMFFHIFNLMYSSGKQIVLTSDRQPDELEGLEDRLVSRFSSGLSISIDPPDNNTLIEILKFKIKANGANIDMFDEDALAYIASKNSKNIRELEGGLNRILFFNVTMKNLDHISLDIAIKAFEGETKKQKNKGVVTLDKIINTVANYYNLPPKEITSKVRTGQISLARHIAMYLCRSLLDLPFTQISIAFQKKDHTTVMSGCQKVEKLLKTDDKVKKAITELKSLLKTA